MDKEGFGELLRSRKVSEEMIAPSIDLAERFEAFTLAPGNSPDAQTTWQFCNMLINEEQNTYDSLLTIARYGRFIRNNAIYIAIVEVLDGAEAQPNLFQKVGEVFGDYLRNEVFEGIGVSPMGLPPAEKPFDMFPVIDRLVFRVGQEQTKRLLSPSLRDLPDEYYRGDVQTYHRSSNIDEYLRRKHRSLVRHLRKLQRAGELFYTQEITDEVVAFIEINQEIESGVRDGNVLYISKIPYNTKQYLATTDPTLKRFYACHCPWARQSIKNGNLHLDPVFCYCSGGYVKKPWEVIFGQTLKVELLESVIKGDFHCRFAVHLPEILKVGAA